MAGSGQTDVPGPPLATGHVQVASCVQSASTNAPSVTVVIYGDASADRTVGPARNLPVAPPMSYPAGSPDVVKFLADVQAVGDVTRIPIGGCAKSVSFGTTTRVTAYGKTSGDLQCANTATLAQAALVSDCDILLGGSE
jgi:hypothetical protein